MSRWRRTWQWAPTRGWPYAVRWSEDGPVRCGLHWQDNCLCPHWRCPETGQRFRSVGSEWLDKGAQ